jgi:DUF4097 and DUF4098 domain-containing protein YvlB
MMCREILRGSAKAAGLLVAACLLAPDPAFAHRMEKRFSVELRPVVTMRNKSGRITVKSWEKQEVLVIANHVSEKTEVDAEQAGNRVDVMTHLVSDKATPEELRADYEITVPAETELQIRNDSGDVYVERISGDMTFETVAADVSLQEVAGYLEVKTVGGSLVCVRCAGRIEVSSVSGNFRFIQPFSSNIRASTTTGTIFYDGHFQPGGTYLLKSYTGQIEVRFYEADSFELNASSLQGKVENEASLKPLPHSRRPPDSGTRYASSFFGYYNNGTARVQLTSFSGTIKVLRKREAQ